MTKVKQILERVARVRPIAFEDEVQVEWIAELDGQLREWAVENFITAVEVLEAYDADTELMVGYPHDRVYDLYILAQADAMGKEADFNNSAMIFNAALDEFKKWYHRRNGRVERKAFINIW